MIGPYAHAYCRVLERGVLMSEVPLYSHQEVAAGV